jgi:hypothetical protein
MHHFCVPSPLRRMHCCIRYLGVHHSMRSTHFRWASAFYCVHHSMQSTHCCEGRIVRIGSLACCAPPSPRCMHSLSSGALHCSLQCSTAAGAPSACIDLCTIRACTTSAYTSLCKACLAACTF